MQKVLPVIFVAITISTMSASAQTSDVDALNQKVEALTEAVQSLQTVIDAQNKRIETLEQQDKPRQGFPPRPDPFTSKPADPSADGTDQESELKNPDIGVIMDLVGVSTESSLDEDGNDKRSVRSLELTLGQEFTDAIRFDSTLSISDYEDNVEIDEAFATYDNVLWGFGTRAGRFRPLIGKANTVHVDELDTVDEPLVIQQYLGLRGLSRTGTEVFRDVPEFSDNLKQELTLGFIEGGIGDAGNLFGDVRRHPSAYAHLSSVLDFTPNTNLEVGNTFLLGSSGEEKRNNVQLYGLNITAQHWLDEIRRVKWQTEFYHQERDDVFTNDDALGYYSLLDYRINDRYGAGLRYDNVEPVATRGNDEAFSGYATFYQSKFARLRFQYQKINFAEGGEDDRFYLQGVFAIGTHKHTIK